MVEEEYCPNCGEKENIHTNYDYSKKDRPVENYLCNECETYFLPIKNETIKEIGKTLIVFTTLYLLSVGFYATVEIYLILTK